MSGTYLVTGGSGFFGGVLVDRLLADGHRCVNLDVAPSPRTHERLENVAGDVADAALVDRLFAEHGFDGVLHCAAVLAHAVKDEAALRRTNVDGTRVLAEAAARHGVAPFVFTSSNCVYARSYDAPVAETEPTGPIEVYGRSKRAAEELLAGVDGLRAVVLRPPTILDEGRLGLLAILFAFVEEGRRVWVVGGGRNRYQFVYARDLADACVRALAHDRSDLFHVGADDVPPLRDVFAEVARRAGTGARVASLPRGPTLLAMRAAHRLGLSPLGPYHYRMIASNFVFDTAHIKAALGWRPTLDNTEMLWRAYRYYRDHKDEIHAREGASAHRSAAKMGAIRVLKWLS